MPNRTSRRRATAIYFFYIYIKVFSCRIMKIYKMCLNWCWSIVLMEIWKTIKNWFLNVLIMFNKFEKFLSSKVHNSCIHDSMAWFGDSDFELWNYPSVHLCSLFNVPVMPNIKQGQFKAISRKNVRWSFQLTFGGFSIFLISGGVSNLPPLPLYTALQFDMNIIWNNYTAEQ